MGSTDSLAALARPLLAEAGLDLWDIEVGPSMVRILVDRPDGVDLDALSAATRVLSPLLDEREDLVPEGRYDLEVSSPGIERTLRTVEQYRRYTGSPLTLKTTIAIGGSRRLRATLVAVTDDAIEVVVDGSPQPVTVPLDQIDRARTVLEWGPKPRQTKTGQTKTRQTKPRPAKGHPKAQSHQSKPQPGKSKAKQVKPAQQGKPTKDDGMGDPSPRLQLGVEGRSWRSPKGVVPLWHDGGVVGDNQAGTAGTSTAAGLVVAGRGAFLRSQARR